MTRANGRAPNAAEALRAAGGLSMAPEPADPTVTLATTIVNGIVQGVVNGLAQVLHSMPLRQHRLCAPCFAALREWENAHKPQIAEAGRAMEAAIEADEAASHNPADYLSEQLRVQIPAVQYAVTAVGGTEVCERHVIADQQAAQKSLLAAPHVDLGALAKTRGRVG